MFCNLARVEKPEDFPDGPCYVIVEFDSYVPYTGWEKESGPAEKSVLPRFYVTTSREEWEEEIRRRERKKAEERTRYTDPPNKYIAYYVDGLAKIQTQININVNIGA